MKTVRILEPILEGGVQNTNFFNGRLLSARDFTEDREAQSIQRQRLAQVLSDGIIYGLEVSAVPGTSVLSITPGLALNRRGQTLYLPADGAQVDIETKEKKRATVTDIFYECPRTVATKPIPTGTGIYILLMSQASDFEGEAPVCGFGGEGKITGCDSRYEVEGIQFDMIKVDVKNLPDISEDAREELTGLLNSNDVSAISRLRNMFAFLCFGAERASGFVEKPFGLFTSYSILDTLRSLPLQLITDCDVPLAVVYWTVDRIKFVDMWSVRRRPAARFPSERWQLPLGERRLTDAEASLLQFQEQVDGIASGKGKSELAAIKVKDYFRYLPAAGMIPILPQYVNEYQKEAGAVTSSTSVLTGGFYPPKFFEGLTHRKPAFIEGAKVESLIRESLSYPPIDMKSEEMVWLYMVRENIENISESQPYMIFTSGHIPYQGDARYDLYRWDYSNYSIIDCCSKILK